MGVGWGSSPLRDMSVPVLAVVVVLVSLAVVAAAVGATHALTAKPAAGSTLPAHYLPQRATVNGSLTEAVPARRGLARFP